MAWGTISSVNMTDAPENLFIYINDELSGFPVAMFLFTTFMIFTMGTYYINRRMTGDGDITVSITVGMWVTSILAILLRILGDGMVSNLTVAIVLGGALLSVMFLFFSRRE